MAIRVDRVRHNYYWNKTLATCIQEVVFNKKIFELTIILRKLTMLFTCIEYQRFIFQRKKIFVFVE